MIGAKIRIALIIRFFCGNFSTVVLSYVKRCIPIKTVRLGRRDPHYITPLIKSMLNKRNKLIRRGHTEAAETLASDINPRIAEVLCHRLDRLADSGVKEMLNAVKAKKVLITTE